MVYFFLILTMISLVLFIIGLINPSLVIFHFKKRRFLVILIYGTLALASLIILLITSPPPQPSLPLNDELPTVTSEVADQNTDENQQIDQQANQSSSLDDWLRESEKYFSPKDVDSEQYETLTISLVTRFDQLIEIIGETDLPNGSILEILFRQLSTPKYPNQFDLEAYTLVQNNGFQITFHAPGNYQFSQGPFQIRVSFSPDIQIPAIQNLVGKKGEKLKGKKSRTENQIKILEDIKEVNFEFEIKPSSQH